MPSDTVSDIVSDTVSDTISDIVSDVVSGNTGYYFMRTHNKILRIEKVKVRKLIFDAYCKKYKL